MGTDASSLKLTVLDPGRKVISEQTHNLSVLAGQSLTFSFFVCLNLILIPGHLPC